MASRRSRIKGIANIPQRRKPNAEPPLSQDDVKREETNLTSSPGQVIGLNAEYKPAATPEVVAARQETNLEQTEPDKSSANVGIDQDKSGASKVAYIAPDLQSISKNDSNATKLTEKQEEKVNTQPTTSASRPQPSCSRRRLIKPAISLKAIQKSITPTSISPTAEDLQPSQPEVANNTPATPQPSDQAANVPKPAPIKDDVISKEISLLGITKLPLGQNMDNNCLDKLEEVARPPPACSPSKYMNRARIKAVPRLGQRRPSFSIGSASESEDESKKSYKTLRIRNDSVCSSVSMPAPPESPAPMSEAGAARKKPEFNSIIQRKCRRTDQSRKLAEARRDFQAKFNNGKPDRQKLTMIDLIFYNPSSSPMSQKRKRKDTETESIMSTRNEAEDVDDPPTPEEPAAAEKAVAEQSDEENTVPAPQITIGPNGEIVIDEKSLYIENKDVKRDRELLNKSNLVDGDTFDTSYGVFKRVKRSKDWNKEETLRFYKALNTIGTDFTLMCALFPDRNRRELKMKFKKEERINRALIDRAVMQPIEFDITELQQDMERQALEELRKEQIRKDKQHFKDMRKAIKDLESEQKGVEIDTEGKDDAVEVPKMKRRKRAVKVVNRNKVIQTPTPIPNAKEALKNKLQRGINSLIDSDDSDEDAMITNTNKDKAIPELNENNNHIVQDDGAIDLEAPLATSTQVDVHLSEETVETVEVPMDELNDIVEGSIVVSSSFDANGEEIYAVHRVNEHGDKIPLELNPDVLDALLKNQKEQEIDPEADATLEIMNPDESLILPSDTSMDNIMADISLSNINALNVTTADCMILSFDDIDASAVAENAATKIVAIQSQTTP